MIHFHNMSGVQGTNGSQLWDTCFAVQAFLEVSQSCWTTICRFRVNEIFLCLSPSDKKCLCI